MPEYIPEPYRGQSLVIGRLHDLTRLVTTPTIVRQAKITNWESAPGTQAIHMAFEGLNKPVAVNAELGMTFGDEMQPVAKYLFRVVEPNDQLDVIVDPRYAPQVSYLWIHIDYMEACPPGLVYSRKDDGLFAMRAKSGEKAERLVARSLSQDFGHHYAADRLISPGVFRIWYTGKRQRVADLTCRACGLTVEVKKRNYDMKYRVSHSVARPFWADNGPCGWHAFVFPDMSIHWISNQTVERLIRGGRCIMESDRYDAYAEIPEELFVEEAPPMCGH